MRYSDLAKQGGMIFPPSWHGDQFTPAQEREMEARQAAEEEAEEEALAGLPEPYCHTCGDVGTVNGVPCVDCSTDQ